MAAKRSKPVCGIVRPVSPVDGWPSDQWDLVHGQIVKALSDEFEIRLVSETPFAGIIQGNIVEHLFDDDIVICDVSAENPNVMLELGMRLAFDKPVVVIKDDVTKSPDILFFVL